MESVTSKWLRGFSCMMMMLLGAGVAHAAEIKIAVSANFKPAMQEIQKAYEAKSHNTLSVNYGSTGKFYTEIKTGFPFEVFLAGDNEHPEKLEKDQLAVEGTRFTYAIGQLVLWSPKAGVVDDKGEVLKGDFKKLAMPNPKLSTYGVAAEEVLKNLQLSEKVAARLVLAEHSLQAYQFVSSGAVEMGFVGLVELKAQETIPGSYWMIPANLYSPLEQQAILLKKGQGNPAAQDFLEYLKSKESRAVIEKFGYK
jgi:molybdate transport system substrate-binding protein